MYQLTAEKAVKGLTVEEKQVEVTVAQKVQLQYNAKSLAGKALL